MMLCAIAATTLAGPANAVAGVLELQSPSPVALSGELAVSLAGGSLVQSDPLAEGARLLEGATGRLTVWGYEAARGEVAVSTVSAQFSAQLDHARAQTYDLAGSDLVLAARQEPVAFRIVPGSNADLRVTSPVDCDSFPGFLGAGVASAQGTPISAYRAPEEVPWRWDPGWLFYGQHELQMWPQPWLALRDPVAHLSGTFRLQMLGGNLSFVDAQGQSHAVRLGVWSDSGTALPHLESQVETIRWAIFEGSLAPSQLPLDGTWGAATPTPEWTLTGALTWRHATGTITTDGVPHHLVDEDVRVEGDLVVRPRPSADPGTRYAGEGEVDGLWLARQAVTIAPPPEPTVPPAASLAALLLGALGAWALYTRVRGGKPLDHPMRRAIYEYVVGNPGIYKRELQRAVGCGWGAFQFHFRALERPGYLRTQAQGKYLLVFSGHAKPMQTTTIVPNPLARRIYDAIPEGRSVLLHDLRIEMGISYQLLKYHLRGLEARGLVQRVEAPSRSVSLTRRPTIEVPVAVPVERAAPRPPDAM